MAEPGRKTDEEVDQVPPRDFSVCGMAELDSKAGGARFGAAVAFLCSSMLVASSHCVLGRWQGCALCSSLSVASPSVMAELGRMADEDVDEVPPHVVCGQYLFVLSVSGIFSLCSCSLAV